MDTVQARKNHVSFVRQAGDRKAILASLGITRPSRWQAFAYALKRTGARLTAVKASRAEKFFVRIIDTVEVTSALLKATGFQYIFSLLVTLPYILVAIINVIAHLLDMIERPCNSLPGWRHWLLHTAQGLTEVGPGSRPFNIPGDVSKLITQLRSKAELFGQTIELHVLYEGTDPILLVRWRKGWCIFAQDVVCIFDDNGIVKV